MEQNGKQEIKINRLEYITNSHAQGSNYRAFSLTKHVKTSSIFQNFNVFLIFSQNMYNYKEFKFQQPTPNKELLIEYLYNNEEVEHFLGFKMLLIIE